MTKQNKIYKMVYMGLLVSMALVLSLIERMLPVPFIAPGAKLGLANLIIVISVYTLDSYKDSFIILIRYVRSLFLIRCKDKKKSKR